MVVPGSCSEAMHRGGCHCLRSAKALAQQQKEELQTLRSECEDWDDQLLKSDHWAEMAQHYTVGH